MRRSIHLLPVLLYLALAMWVCYPLWLHPSSHIQSLGDPLLNAYILDWDHYALFHQIFGFFQANVFWPHADALAYGEHLLAPALLALPFRLMTSSAVAIHNLSLVQAYFFSAISAYLLALHYFKRIDAATLAGLVYGFAHYRIAQIVHVQLIHGEFLPLMILGFEKVLSIGDRRWVWLLGAAAWGQWMTSWYWAVFSFWLFAPYMMIRLFHKRRELNRTSLLYSISPLVIAAVCSIPVAWPYMRLSRMNVLVRPAEATRDLSAIPSDFLRSTDRLWLDKKVGIASDDSVSAIGTERPLHPGWIPLAGLVAGCALLARKQNSIVPEFPGRLWLVLTLLMIVFCLGSHLNTIPLPYALVARWFPFAGSIRVAARWMLPALLGFSMLAGYALNGLRELVKGRRKAQISLWAISLCILESLTVPVPAAPVDSKPHAVFEWLAEQEFPSPVLELPISTLDNNLPMLHATWHRQPTVNGTNGFFPPDQLKLLRELEKFPSPETLASLRGIRVRFVVIDTDAAYGGQPQEMESKIRKLEEQLKGKATILRFDPYLVADLKDEK